MTYRELDDAAGRLAREFESAGIRAGDRAALFLSAGLEFVRVFYALQRLGAVPCAFSPSTSPEAAAKRASVIGARLVVTDDRWSGGLPPADPLPDDIAWLQPTSGTSGEPRRAMVSHRNVLAVLGSAEEALGFGPDDVFVCWVPPWHDLGLVRFIVGAVSAGAPCHLVTPSISSIPQWLATIDAVGGTISGAPDFAWRLATRLVRPGTVHLSTLRCATNGGEPVRSTTLAALEKTFGLRKVVVPGYGLAEATLGVTCVRPGEAALVDERGNVSCGRPFPGVDVRVDDAGEILVRGPGVFAGYFGAPEETAEILRDGWLYTGDIGRLDDDGSLYVLGRRRAMLKRGGAPLAPRELEEAAQTVDGVKIAAAVGIATAESTEDIVVVVESESGGEHLEAAVADAVRRAVGFTPERVVVLPPRSIPRTANGKVRHQALRERIRVLTCEVSSSGNRRT